MTALNLYITAEETKKFFGLPITAQSIEFSYLTTALNYVSICKWLGLESKHDVEMKGLKPANLKLAFGWFFAKDAHGRTVIGETRRLSELAAIVRTPKATSVLIETKRLDEAYLYTDGPQQALEIALQQALAAVSTVWRMLPEFKDVTKAHAELAKQVADEARQVRNAISSRLEDDA